MTIPPLDDKNLIELDLLSGLIVDYEEKHYPIKSPSLVDVIKLRKFEMGLNQVKLSELLGPSPSRTSDYLTGRSEPTLKLAREITPKLNINEVIVGKRISNIIRLYLNQYNGNIYISL